MLLAHMTGRSPLREITIVYLVVAALTFAITRLPEEGPLGDLVHVLVAAVFLLFAVKLAQREPGGMRRFGIDLGGVLVPPDEAEGDGRAPGPFGLWDLFRAIRSALPAAAREIGVALVVMIAIFPAFAVGFQLYHQPSHPFVLRPPPDLLEFALTQLVVVALPEEALFRGYFQTRLTDAFPRTVRFLGADVSIPALIGQAALFAIVHFVVDFSPERLAVFFPGLLFGWLRAWRGGIGASILLHAASNVYADVLVKGWL
jgi:hypothetical protein